ncbi:MAG: DUF1194 domain-containing protein [Hyphomicrobiaceae bacterium]|nr:DUF1194 domain-containing protein [Hyphomicrobiaceae bacterium]
MPRRLFALFCLALTLGLAAPARAETEVDLELVLSVDISYSMDPEEQQLQRMGYVDGLLSREVIDAIAAGLNGRIAVTYVEWAGAFEQRVIVPWTLIDGRDAARGFTDLLAEAPIRRAYRTSIASALDYAAPLFDRNGFDGARKVIDVSGDGANNQGRTVTVARDDVLARGIVINGLPIQLKRPTRGMDIVNLDDYYRECVIGGPNAFVVPVKDRDGFADAIRKKLVLEIAGAEPLHMLVRPANIGPPVDCLIGEKLWQERDWLR